MTDDNKYYITNETTRCLLCHDPLCTKACPKHADTGAVIRSLFFQNRAGAAQKLKDFTGCNSCQTRACQKACLRKLIDSSIDIPYLMEYAQHQKKTTTPPSLAITFCGFPCENPYILGSSVISSNYEMCATALRAGWAGVVTKTCSYFDIKEASPRFDISEKQGTHFSGFKNLEMLSDHSIDENMAWIARLKRDFPTKLIVVSIMGANEAEWEELARRATQSGADVIECNFSCPQMTYKGTGADTGQNSQLVLAYTRACRRGSHLPILAKLTPNLSTPDEFVQAALEGGADGIAGINTIKSLTTVRPDKEGHLTGQDAHVAISGYSGRAVKPIALRFMHDTARILSPKKHTISGIGGITTWEDALDFLLIGCANVQVCSAVMEYGYRIIDDLTEGLASYMEQHGIQSLQQIVGTALPTIVTPDQLNRTTKIIPKIDNDKCIGCGRCYLSCRDGGHQAIVHGANRKASLILDKCVGCMLCYYICPVDAISEGQRVEIK